MTNGDGKQKETLALKVFAGPVMARSERKKNEGSGEWRGNRGAGGEGRGGGAESSIIEGESGSC